jgi:hypothetical protein
MAELSVEDMGLNLECRPNKQGREKIRSKMNYSPLGKPKYTLIANQLTTAPKALHECTKSNPSLALDLITKTFPPNLTQSIPVAHYSEL